MRTRIGYLTACVCALVTTITGCIGPREPAAGISLNSQQDHIECPTSPVVPNALYIGPYKGFENNLDALDIARDFRCAAAFKNKFHPNGFVTILGSSRIRAKNTSGDPSTDSMNDRLYADVYAFAKTWTERYGNKYPILTGAGPGLMEAGSRGAADAEQNALAVGYTTYYDPPAASGGASPYGGDPTLAFQKINGRDITGQGLIFSSITVREMAMILHSAAIVIAPGGTGTEWETYQTLEMLKSKQLQCIPVFVFGNESTNWLSLKQRIADMVRRGTLRQGEAVNFIKFESDPQALIASIAARLPLTGTSAAGCP